MAMLLMGLGWLLSLLSFVCFIILLIDAFKNEIWKGILSFFCFIYQIYYAFVEFQHPNKTLIILGYLVGGIAGGLLIMAGAGSAAIGAAS